jgi:hypothetical protein
MSAISRKEDEIFVLDQQVEKSDSIILRLEIELTFSVRECKSQRPKAQLETEVSAALINLFNCTAPDFDKASQLNCKQTLD